MGRRKKGEPPAYLKHRATGQAYATFAGKSVYFGAYGSADSRRKYLDFVRRWERTHGQVIIAEASRAGTLRAHVAAYLADRAGTISDQELADTKRNLGVLTERYGGFAPDDFRSAEFRAMRDDFLRAGQNRKTANKSCGRVLRFFRWLVSREECSADTRAVLEAVPTLAAIKGAERPRVEAVPEKAFWATIKQMSEPNRTIALVMFYAGCRPSEACEMRGDEIYRTGTLPHGRRTLKVPRGVWLFQPTRRKTGDPVPHVVGPKLQAILKPWLNADGPLFGKSRHSLGKSIKAAAVKAGVPHWHPHQIRHLFVTRMDAATDLVTASEATGHAGIDTSAIYLQRKILSVADVARRLG